ncbi:hypothetical protein PR048_029308 [Dryococelus australis]|uniref:Calcium/calmodulin-dependent protein kinase II association-domain domain-containing protein n=1 Tax=Dryococelus australis TaxID=614101 RepID=A0ABQ9GDN2_9NEOP|nr:hypothetical protein PR048_029308 [Dryococelus australis]
MCLGCVRFVELRLLCPNKTCSQLSTNSYGSARKQEIIKMTEQLIEAINTGDYEAYTTDALPVHSTDLVAFRQGTKYGSASITSRFGETTLTGIPGRRLIYGAC